MSEQFDRYREQVAHFTHEVLQKNLGSALRVGDHLETAETGKQEVDDVFNLMLHYTTSTSNEELVEFMTCGIMRRVVPEMYGVPSNPNALPNDALSVGQKVEVTEVNYMNLSGVTIGQNTPKETLDSIFRGVTVKRISDGKEFRLPASMLLMPKGFKLNGNSSEESREIVQKRLQDHCMEVSNSAPEGATIH